MTVSPSQIIIIIQPSRHVNRSTLKLFQKPAKDSWGTGLDAMQTALELEKTVNQALLDIHKIGQAANDPQVDKTFSFPFHFFKNWLYAKHGIIFSFIYDINILVNDRGERFLKFKFS